VLGSEYDYSLVEYNGSKVKVNICKVHGIFEQSPNNHISKLQNCPVCSNMHLNKSTNDEFIIKSNLIHKMNMIIH
jgi:hypothetical protein